MEGGEGGEQTKMEVERLLTGSGVRGGGVSVSWPVGANRRNTRSE